MVSKTPYHSFGHYYVVVAPASGLQSPLIERVAALAHKTTHAMNAIDDLGLSASEDFGNNHHLYPLYVFTHSLEHFATLVILKMNIDEIISNLARNPALFNPQARRSGILAFEGGITQFYKSRTRKEGIQTIVGFSFKNGLLTNYEDERKGVIRACEIVSRL